MYVCVFVCVVYVCACVYMCCHVSMYVGVVSIGVYVMWCVGEGDLGFSLCCFCDPRGIPQRLG